MEPIYLDHNATTPIAPAARLAAVRFLEIEFGNPSSTHAKGRIAKAAVDEARAAVAELLGAAASEIVFTGSATESNNLALMEVMHEPSWQHLQTRSLSLSLSLSLSRSSVSCGRS